jgi:hypothetical protein
MSRATGILNRVNSVMRRFAPLTRTCYKRVITSTGGDALIGRPGSVTHVDTLLDPQPIFQELGRKTVPGGRDRVGITTEVDKQRVADDYRFLVSPTALSMDELAMPNLCLVLKDDAGVEDVMYIHDFTPVGLNDTVVAITVYVRSVKRS